MRIKIFNQNPFGTNTYLLYCEKSGLGAIIDPTGSYDNIVSYIDDNSINIKYILLTHGHFDHIQLVGKIKDLTQGLICIHKDDFLMLQDAKLNLSYMSGQPISIEADKSLIHGEQLSLGKYNIEVLHTPGHTKGSSCFLVDEYLFSGDTLFKGNIGRTDLPSGNYDAIIQSLDIIRTLDTELKVFPGHGEETILKDEIINNPYIRS